MQRWANSSKLSPSWSSLPRRDKDLIHQLYLEKLHNQPEGVIQLLSLSFSALPSLFSSLSPCPYLSPKLRKLTSNHHPHLQCWTLQPPYAHLFSKAILHFLKKYNLLIQSEWNTPSSQSGDSNDSNCLTLYFLTFKCNHVTPSYPFNGWMAITLRTKSKALPRPREAQHL